ncbi:GSCOCG00000128001-RA-CDS [Cotesia congregata]|nr:GSCOCG00000128001-RA-CDS [Cotesia congregata]
MSLYLSTIGMINGPLLLRLSDGRESMKGIKGSPSTAASSHESAG